VNEVSLTGLVPVIHAPRHSHSPLPRRGWPDQVKLCFSGSDLGSRCCEDTGLPYVGAYDRAIFDHELEALWAFCRPHVEAALPNIIWVRGTKRSPDGGRARPGEAGSGGGPPAS
jgi:hypothetical protein